RHSLQSHLLLLLTPRPPCPPLFPYTTLFRSLQVDALGVAAALEVEDAVGAPAVLVVADQLAAGVGGQGGLAGAGQAEEDGGLMRSEEHTSELQSRFDLVCRLLLEKKKNSPCS